MDDELVLALVFLVIEMTQSISVGIILLFKNNTTPQRNTLLLSFFLIAFGLSKLPEIISLYGSPSSNIYSIHAESCINFITPTLLYLYVNSIMIKSNNKLRRSILIFSTLSFFLGLSFFMFLPHIKNLSIDLIEYYSNFSLIYVLSIFIIIFCQIPIHNSRVRQMYSNVKNRELSWVFYLTAFYIFVTIIIIVYFLSMRVSPFYEELIISSVSLLWILGMAYNGLIHQTSLDLLENTLSEISDLSNKASSNKTLFSRLNEKIKQEQLFLNTDLTILDVSLAINEHPKLVSKIINENADLNFNSFINKFRIDYAKTMLIDTENSHISIEGIGELSGFKSNSAFYTAFNKELKTTPLKFQKSHREL